MRSLLAVLVSLPLLSTDALASSDCKTQSGKVVSMSNGATTSGLTAWVHCKYSRGHSIKKRYVKGKVVEEKWYYANGKPQQHGYFWYTANGNSRRDKTWREWWDNGNKRSVETYHRGDKVGSFQRFDQAGHLSEEGLYHKDRKVAAKRYNDDGSLEGVTCTTEPSLAAHRVYGAMCGFKRRSEVTTFFSRGKRARRFWFAEGKRVAFERYDLSGNLVSSDRAAAPGKVGVKISRHRNGKTKQETRYNESGRLHGVQREYDVSGPLTREAVFDDGKMSRETLYFFNGQVKRKTERHVEGRETRVLASSYYDNGKLESKGQYIERRRYESFGYGSYWNYRTLAPYGVHKEYRRDGTLRAVERYKDGKREGISTWYHEGGRRKSEEREYVDGRLARKKEYDESGRLISHEEVFADGSSKRHRIRR